MIAGLPYFYGRTLVISLNIRRGQIKGQALVVNFRDRIYGLAREREEGTARPASVLFTMLGPTTAPSFPKYWWPREEAGMRIGVGEGGSHRAQ